MAKPQRLHAPGCIVHITARTQGHEPWFSESLRARIAGTIAAAAPPAGHLLLAYSIMPNHFHILLKQGRNPLHYMMHRVMHRTAALLRSTHRLQGHVYERRYWSGPCLRANYVRSAVTYVHLNAWRAGLCADPAEYAWSSHCQYLTHFADPRNEPVRAAEGMRFFQTDEAPESALSNYVQTINYLMGVDRAAAGELAPTHLVPPDTCRAGDAHWDSEYAETAAAWQPALPARPLYDVARSLLERIEPACPLDLVRSGTRARPITTIRRQMIAALLAQGFRGVALARFFGVSQTLVSNIAIELRS